MLKAIGSHWDKKKKKAEEKEQENTRAEQWLPLDFLLLSAVFLRISKNHRKEPNTKIPLKFKYMIWDT